MTRAVAASSTALVLAALVLVWVERASAGRDLYVSELGAPGEPSAPWFRLALTLLVAGGLGIGWATRSVRSSVGVLALWLPSATVWTSSGFFLVAAQVPCTPGCPIPLGATFTVEDFVHTSAAVLAFAAGCWAMLQVSFSRGRRAVAYLSRACAVGVGAIAAAGGLMSLANWNTHLGGRLELVATTVGMLWLAGYGAAVLLPARAPERRVPPVLLTAARSASTPGADPPAR